MLSGSPVTTLQAKLPEVKYFDHTSVDVSVDVEDDVILTPEDENNPDLLAELKSLHVVDKRKSISELSEQELVDAVAELKGKVLTLKRAGDLEGAKAALIEYNAHEKQLNQVRSLKAALSATKTAPKQPESPATIASTVKTELPASSSKPQSPLTSPKPASPTSPAVSETPSSPKPKDAAVYRDLFAKLQKQSAQCVAVADSYSQANRATDAKLFLKRKQAFDLDVLKLRAMLRDKQPPPAFRVVNVTYEMHLTNADIPEGQLQVTLGDLKITNSRKCKLKGDGEQYELRVFYDLPGLAESESTQTSAPFTTTGLERNSLAPFTFKCGKKDIRSVKAVEYKKIRIEIVAEEGFLFFKSKVVKLTGQVKLDRLLKDCTFQAAVDLMDVDGEKRSSLPSAIIILTARVKCPLSSGSEATKQINEKWTVIPGFGNSNHVLYSCLPPPDQPKSPIAVAPQIALPDMNATGTIADKIKSFEVIEFELEALAQKKAEVMNDPQLMDLQIALEGLRDRLQMQVEIGQLSIAGKNRKNVISKFYFIFKDYLASVKKCINDTKLFALQAKREGDLVLAGKFVKHVDIMRKEVAEAEASLAESHEE